VYFQPFSLLFLTILASGASPPDLFRGFALGYFKETYVPRFSFRIITVQISSCSIIKLVKSHYLLPQFRCETATNKDYQTKGATIH